MSNRELASIFSEIADLLDLDGERFKPDAYRRVARTLDEMSTDVAVLDREDRLGEVPGVGEAIAKKIGEYVSTGQVGYLEKLRAQHPPGLLDLLRVDGLGPKTTRRLYTELQVDSPAALMQAIQDAKLDGLKGFGPRKIELLRTALNRAPAKARTPLAQGAQLVSQVLQELQASGAPLVRLTVAGSFRRRKESVGDLDFVATSGRPKEVMEAFVDIPLVEEVKLSGDTKTTVVIRGGMQVDLRVVPEEAFGATLQYLTGSKDHNIRLRTLAQARGLSLNEYGVTRGETLVSTPTEAEVYAALDLPFIPPELREDKGEIEAAREGRLPALLPEGQLAGELHIHASDVLATSQISRWSPELAARGLTEAGLVLPASEAGPDRWEDLRSAVGGHRGKVHWRAGWETSPSQLKSTPPPSDVDFLAVRPEHGKSSLTLEGLNLGHPPLVLFSHLENLEGLETMVSRNAIDPRYLLEITVTEDRSLPLPGLIRAWTAAKGKVVLSAEPTGPSDLTRLDLAVGTAARAWVARSTVWNAVR